MQTRIIIASFAGVILIVVGVYLFRDFARCFANSGGVELITPPALKQNQPIAVQFKMIRISATGCFEGKSSESYKNVNCGYRTDTNTPWISARLAVIADNETEYLVECQIPPISSQTSELLVLHYYFEYSAWDNPPARQFGSQAVH